MGVLKLQGFSGMWPARDNRALPENAAADAQNIRVDGGGYLKGLPGLSLVKALQTTTRSVYRIPTSSTLSGSYWMEFTDENTDVVRAPVINDSYERFYWCSPTDGLRYAPKANIVGGGGSNYVGVAPPATAPTVEVVDGSGEIVDGENVAPEETREYLVTFISIYGEESAPGPAYEVVGFEDQQFQITDIPQPAPASGYATVDTIRIYRTVTGISGIADFYKVVDLPLGTLSYIDEIDNVTVSGQTVLESSSWAIPLTGLQGLVAMPNGIFASWKDNNVYFSENFRPHAWPAEYTINLDSPVVGCGVFGNSLVVCTQGTPYVISGSKAGGMSMTKVDVALPCLSRRSIVSAPEGVYYSSEPGLVLIGPQGVGVVTQDLIARDQWRNNYAPSTHHAALVGPVYHCFKTVGSVTDGFSFVPSNPPSIGVNRVLLEVEVLNIGVEPWTGKPWVIGDNNRLYEYESPDVSPLRYSWRSKQYVYPKPVNFGFYQAFYDDGGSVSYNLYAVLRGRDGSSTRQLVHSNIAMFSGFIGRLPSGYKSDVWEIELSGTAEVQGFFMATSAEELRRV